jgi:hypothetical protein
MPVDVNRLSKALTIITSASMGMIAPDSPVGGKKVNRGARLCELGGGSGSPTTGPGGQDQIQI